MTLKSSIECETIRKNWFDSLLLVTGSTKVKWVDYFRHTSSRPYFSSLMMEVQPLSTDEYKELKTLGLDGVMVYQETYHEPYQLSSQR